jgi:hypothetical protein
VGHTAEEEPDEVGAASERGDADDKGIRLLDVAEWRTVEDHCLAGGEAALLDQDGVPPASLEGGAPYHLELHLATRSQGHREPCG